MASKTAHDRLLGELRSSSVGAPVIPDVDLTGPVRKVSWDALLPLILGALRTDMVRSLAATCFGTGVAVVGVVSQLTALMSKEKSMVLEVLGGSLALWAFVGLPLPGRMPFLEAKTPAGFHCLETKRNVHLRTTFNAWLAGFTPTPWLKSGEWCTVLPFFWTPNKAKDLSYERVWVQNPNDHEHVACDWVFPPGGHDPARPVVILLTGLAPDVHWTVAGGFVANSAWYLSHECNMTAVVMVSRGTMDTKVKERGFHGARSQDVREVILLAERAMRVARGEKSDGAAKTPLPLFASGFSMGAIIISNYCGRFGDDCRLAGVVHFSGMYDGIYNMKFEYSAKTWQTYLAYGLKANMLGDRMSAIAEGRGVDMRKVMSRQVESVVDIDEDFIAVFNGYKGGAKEYYRDMCLGLEEKWKNVKVPILAICAKDDPITHCDAFHAEEFSAGNENLLFLVTERGGHVGWPWGVKPWERGFDFMTEGIRIFVEAMVSND